MKHESGIETSIQRREGVARGSRSAYEIFCFTGKRTRNNWALNQGNGRIETANQGKWWKIRSWSREMCTHDHLVVLAEIYAHKSSLLTSSLLLYGE